MRAYTPAEAPARYEVGFGKDPPIDPNTTPAKYTVTTLKFNHDVKGYSNQVLL